MSNSDSSSELSSPKALKRWFRGDASIPKKARVAHTVIEWHLRAPVGGTSSPRINDGSQLPPLLYMWRSSTKRRHSSVWTNKENFARDRPIKPSERLMSCTLKDVPSPSGNRLRSPTVNSGENVRLVLLSISNTWRSQPPSDHMSMPHVAFRQVTCVAIPLNPACCWRRTSRRWRGRLGTASCR